MIHVGFTGTSRGMRLKQARRIEDVIKSMGLRHLGPQVTAHVGDCVGADAEFYGMARRHAWRIIGHVPINPNHRAFLDYTEEMPKLPYLDRNRKIVESCQLLIGAPYEMEEQMRGGTWWTLRHARHRGRAHVIVYPDGSISGLPPQGFLL